MRELLFVFYAYVCSMNGENPRALVINSRTNTQVYYNLLIAPACIRTLHIVRHNLIMIHWRYTDIVWRELDWMYAAEMFSENHIGWIRIKP